MSGGDGIGGVQANASDTSSPFRDGAVVGIGSLPHHDAEAAAAFAIEEFDIATIPSLPMRSPVEAMLAQAVSGVAGLAVAADGTIDIDPAQLDADGIIAGATIVTDLDQAGHTGHRAFIELAKERGHDGAPVKWQFVGPVTLGVALCSAGMEVVSAFDLAAALVRAHVANISASVGTELPASPQMVLLDEPWLGTLMSQGFPIAPDRAIDLMSSAMAAMPVTTLVGIHCCVSSDVATILASGPGVISVPVSPDLVEWAGYLARFVDDGGIIAWGAIPTDGPVPSNSERQWRALSDLWCALVQRGCDPVQLRHRSLVSPQCGLAMHSVPTALRIARLTAGVGKRVKDQSSATRFALGA